jgi:hypothetical protein
VQLPWLLLIYRIPPEPARNRVAVRRRLESMGAVSVQSGVCLLPRTGDHVRRLKMPENEIAGAGGEAVILATVALDRAREEKVVARFRADRDEAYREFLDRCDDFEREIAKEQAARHFSYAEFEENDVDLKKRQGWLAKIVRLDCSGAALRGEAESRLAAREALLDAYARQVFEAQDENA